MLGTSLGKTLATGWERQKARWALVRDWQRSPPKAMLMGAVSLPLATKTAGEAPDREWARGLYNGIPDGASADGVGEDDGGVASEFVGPAEGAHVLAVGRKGKTPREASDGLLDGSSELSLGTCVGLPPSAAEGIDDAASVGELLGSGDGSGPAAPVGASDAEGLSERGVVVDRLGAAVSKMPNDRDGLLDGTRKAETVGNLLGEALGLRRHWRRRHGHRCPRRCRGACEAWVRGRCSDRARRLRGRCAGPRGLHGRFPRAAWHTRRTHRRRQACPYTATEHENGPERSSLSRPSTRVTSGHSWGVDSPGEGRLAGMLAWEGSEVGGDWTGMPPGEGESV
eukprot:scaffold1583_cov299-Pinguiococcus_pyrenoidosus.AAC.22